MSANSIFLRVGGFRVVRHLVSRFYTLVTSSEVLGGYFANVDMRRLIDHQTKFIAAMMGGPVSFDDEQLRRGHRHLGISQAEFDEMVALLDRAMRDCSLEACDRDEVLDQVRRRAPLIVQEKGARQEARVA